MQTELSQILTHGSMTDLEDAAAWLVQGSTATDADIFLKKAEAWAYRHHFLTTLNDVEEMPGRFSVVPIDGLVMSFLDERVAPSCRLPTGPLYDHALHAAIEALMPALDTPIAEVAGDVLELLDRDLGMRDYLLERRLEHFYS